MFFVIKKAFISASPDSQNLKSLFLVLDFPRVHIQNQELSTVLDRTFLAMSYSREALA